MFMADKSSLTTQCYVTCIHVQRETNGKTLNLLGQEKNVLVLVIGRVDFDANKKNAGRKINMTPRKIPNPEFSSLVNHGICVLT